MIQLYALLVSFVLLLRPAVVEGQSSAGLPGEWMNHPNQPCNCQHGTNALVTTGVTICMWDTTSFKRTAFPGYNCNWTPLNFGWCTTYFNCEMRCFCEAERHDWMNHWRSLAKAHFNGRYMVSHKLLVFAEYDEAGYCPGYWYFFEKDENGIGNKYCMTWKGYWDFPPNKVWPGDPFADIGGNVDPYEATNGVGSGPAFTNWSQGPAYASSGSDVPDQLAPQPPLAWRMSSKLAFTSPQAKLRRTRQKAKLAFDTLESDDPRVNKTFIRSMIELFNLTRPTEQEMSE